jgi:hypothetical protein
MTTPTVDRETILQAVEQWPVRDQVALARTILDRAQHLANWLAGTPTVSAMKLRGMGSTDQPAPSDEEVARILEEERMRKYGG